MPAGADVAAHHVVLVGSMGAGKTTVGRLVATSLRRPLIDSDQVLASEGEVASDIARDRGVDALHRRECAQLRTALGSPTPAVVAAAASTIESAACRTALAGHLVVWLQVEPAESARRHEGGDHRRDLGPDPVAAMQALAGRRDPLYEEVADVIVPAGITPEAAARAIVARAAGHPPAPPTSNRV